MRRDTDVDKITFPVSLKTIFYRPKKENTEREIKSYKAVVNEKTGDVLSIVSKDYRLVSNAEAIEYGMECYKKVFQVDNLVNFEIFNIVSSYRGTFCHVDIIDKNYSINIWQKELYIPYLRITNSYNRTRSLFI